jgi:hypothetical protein
LTGQDTIFNNHFIGELNTQNINQRTKNAQTNVKIDFSTLGSAKVIFIQIE